LQLCGWNFDRETASLTAFLERLEAEKLHTRAAAIAVFNMKLRAAIEILNRGAEKVRIGLLFFLFRFINLFYYFNRVRRVQIWE
jgi:hypothetical protein